MKITDKKIQLQRRVNQQAALYIDKNRQYSSPELVVQIGNTVLVRMEPGFPETVNVYTLGGRKLICTAEINRPIRLGDEEALLAAKKRNQRFKGMTNKPTGGHASENNRSGI